MLRKPLVNLSFALVLAAIFTWLLFLLKPDNNLSSIAAAIFSAAGTIVALALPAAELGGNSVIRMAEYWLERAKTETDPEQLKIGLQFIKDTKEDAVMARRGSLYVLFAFLLSGFALLTPRWPWSAQQVVRLDYLLTGAATGFLLFGAILFFPFAWAVYRLGQLDDVHAYIDGLVKTMEAENQQKGSVQDAQEEGALKLHSQNLATTPEVIAQTAPPQPTGTQETAEAPPPS
jgi:hypothetical protein